MISLEISGQQYELNERVEKYVNRKIGGLDKYISRHARKSATGTVKLRQIDGDKGNKYEVEAMLILPGKKQVIALDQAPNIFAAVDIVQTKLLGQIRKYKIEHNDHLGKRGMLSRIKNKTRSFFYKEEYKDED